MSTPAAAEAVKSIPPQHQEQQPGMEAEMTPKPEFIRDSYKGSGGWVGGGRQCRCIYVTASWLHLVPAQHPVLVQLRQCCHG